MKNVVENIEKIHSVLFQHEKVLNTIVGNPPEPSPQPTESSHSGKSNGKGRKKKSKTTSKQSKIPPKKLDSIVEEESSSDESFAEEDLDEELGDELRELSQNNLKRENNDDKDE